MFGEVRLGDGNDVFTNFQKIGKKIKSGTVSGDIDLGAGDDIFQGGNKGELVVAGQGADVIKLGGGNDTYLAFSAGVGGTNADDNIDGGKGIDTYNAISTTTGVVVNLDKIDHQFIVIIPANTASGAEVSGAFVDKIKNFENAIGGDGHDLIFGNGGNNVLGGAEGSDFLFGLGGNDTLIGGGDNDILVGGAGRDTLTGGGGADQFVFSSIKDSGYKGAKPDVITDFNFGQGDKIDVSGIDANTKLANDQAFTFIGNGAFGKNPAELRAVIQGNNTLVQGDVNGDGKADFSVLLKDFTQTLIAGDFIL
ncbi:MAG: calcium-binding protein [Hyphomicrobiales bacterium]